MEILKSGGKSIFFVSNHSDMKYENKIMTRGGNGGVNSGE